MPAKAGFQQKMDCMVDVIDYFSAVGLCMINDRIFDADTGRIKKLTLSVHSSRLDLLFYVYNERR